MQTAYDAGTPLYWSPEAFDRQFGTASDLWAGGLLIAEVLTGKTAYFDEPQLLSASKCHPLETGKERFQGLREQFCNHVSKSMQKPNVQAMFVDASEPMPAVVRALQACFAYDSSLRIEPRALLESLRDEWQRLAREGHAGLEGAVATCWQCA